MRKNTDPTSRHLKNLLPNALGVIGSRLADRPSAVLSAWADVVGPRLAPMAQAVAYEHGILTVKVANSTLYSLLSRHERSRLLAKMRARFPNKPINNITFRMG